MPDLFFDTKDAIPEGLREYAAEKDGKFSVKVAPAAKVDEFRANNVAISQERDALKGLVARVQRFAGEDFDAFENELTEMRGTVQKVKDGALKGTDVIETEVTRRVGSMKTDYERQLSEKANETKLALERAGTYESKYRRKVVEGLVTSAVLNETSGADPRALADIIERASKVFVVKDDGSIEARDGEAIIYGADGATPMTPLEWLGKLKEHAPYFFKNSAGGGAGGGQGGSDKFGGLSPADYSKLSGRQKLELAAKLAPMKR